jgi:hypothetical protein
MTLGHGLKEAPWKPSGFLIARGPLDPSLALLFIRVDGFEKCPRWILNIHEMQNREKVRNKDKTLIGPSGVYYYVVYNLYCIFLMGSR